MENNNVKLVGEITSDIELNHEIYGEKFYDTKIQVKRLSGDVDEISLIVSDRLIMGKNIKLGTIVEINGQLRSYNHYTEEDNKRRLLLNVFVKDIRVVSESELNEDESLGTTNNVELIGHICKKPIYRKTPFGREIADILVAVNRPYGKSDYLPCIAWGRNARFSENLEVGQTIRVLGRIQSRQYNKELEDGAVEERIAFEVSIGTLELPQEDINGIIEELAAKNLE